MNIQKVQYTNQKNIKFGEGLHVNETGNRNFRQAIIDNTAIQKIVHDNPDFDFYINVASKKAKKRDINHEEGEELYKLFFSSTKNLREKFFNILKPKSFRTSLTKHYHSYISTMDFINQLNERQLKKLFK